MASSGLHLDVLGTGFTLTAQEAHQGAALRRLWAGFYTQVPGVLSLRLASTPTPILLVDGTAQLPPPESAAGLIAHCCAALNRLSIEGYVGFAAHAGVIASGDVVLAIPGASGAGKTTLVAACVADGWHYGSDEALCVSRATGDVRPYPKPLALSEWSAAAVGLTGGVHSDGELLVTAAELGGPQMSAPAPLTDVVQLNRLRGSEPHLVPLHRAESVAALLGMSFNHYQEPADSFALVTRLAQRCRAWRLTYSDPVAAARELTRVLR